MVSDVRRFEPLAQQAAELLAVLADPDRLMVCCSLISGSRSVDWLETNLAMQSAELRSVLDALVVNDLVVQEFDDKKVHYHLADIQAAEVVDALCSAFLGEDFSNRAKIPFRPNSRLVGGYGKFVGANI